ncbi:phytoene desaturase family protein [Nakamurella lactea]|uniref:phytoene desaturase family protein n=1 Tax=Nakamurella lactea TaxID=459515 RepID=UPI00041341A4|nr:NAD(P)/FAD-dependent oxidoreductase [Nakamurella lactea]
MDNRIVVVGGGHNGLVAAILAADAGYRVTLLERSDHVGGASIGSAVFAGHDVRLSRYSYLVSLFPDELARRLGIELALKSRPVSSYTPVERSGRPTGLLVERTPGAATEESFRAVTGSHSEFAAWQQLYGGLAAMAAVLAPALTGPLRRRSEVRELVTAAAGGQLWDDVFAAPIGEMITRRFTDDTVRGVVATDALIGTHTSLFDESLLANRCFLYHLIGRGTGEWLLPVGGMGAVADALEARAREVDVDIRCGVEVVEVDERPGAVTVIGRDGDGNAVQATGSRLLAAVAPAVIDGWLGRSAEPVVGAQLKINLLLTRLPALASGVDPATAFAGTTHLREGFDELEIAYRASAAGTIPDPLPSEVYCHSVTDPSIIGPGEAPGTATLTLFGLHAPVDLFRADPAAAKQQAAASALAALQQYLAEPLEECVAVDTNGQPCIEVASPLDVQGSVGMPGGNIFHGDLSWPFAADDEDLDSPARRYGVEVPGSERILLAGAGSRRGGGVSGLGGAAAVDALLATTRP